MTHDNKARCPVCGRLGTVSGYGFAAGPLGFYTYCDSIKCEELIKFTADLAGLEDDEALCSEIKKFQEKLAKRLALFSDRNQAREEGVKR